MNMKDDLETLDCPICTSVMERATKTRCGHNFCYSCVIRAITTRKFCPICRKKVNSKRELTINDNLNILIQKETAARCEIYAQIKLILNPLPTDSSNTTHNKLVEKMNSQSIIITKTMSDTLVGHVSSLVNKQVKDITNDTSPGNFIYIHKPATPSHQPEYIKLDNIQRLHELLTYTQSSADKEIVLFYLLRIPKVHLVLKPYLPDNIDTGSILRVYVNDNILIGHICRFLQMQTTNKDAPPKIAIYVLRSPHYVRLNQKDLLKQVMICYKINEPVVFYYALQ